MKTLMCVWFFRDKKVTRQINYRDDTILPALLFTALKKMKLFDKRKQSRTEAARIYLNDQYISFNA